MSDTDLELLASYSRRRAEDAFTELVRRHLGLVYSAALRQVRSPQLAEEVAQSAFMDLARNAARLKPDTVLTAWLYQVTRRTAIDAVRREASRQLREQIASEMNAMNATADDWTQVEPLLDDAMQALDETDRAAVLLRYFENKSLREVGATLGATENAAGKRINRAVERLREFFAKRGVTVGTSGLVVVISASAVQAAPVGLAGTITTAALSGTAITTTAVVAATKAIAMTTLQKTVITAAFAVAVGTGIYQARQAANARADIQTLQQQQAPLAEQIQQLQSERDKATNRLASLAESLRQRDTDAQSLRTELGRLRGEVGLLRRQAAEHVANPSQAAPTPLASVQEGVYYFETRGSMIVLELKDGNFRYWFRSDVQRSREPAYPLSGRYTTNGATLTLPHQEIYQTNWTSMTYDGKPTLWRPSALTYWDESRQIDPYGVLFPTTRKPEDIWGGNGAKQPQISPPPSGLNR